MILYRIKGPGPANRLVKGNWYEFSDDVASFLMRKHSDHWSGDPKDARPGVEIRQPRAKKTKLSQREDFLPEL